MNELLATLKDYYEKHKDKIWGAVFALVITYAGTQVNTLFESIPEVKEMNNRITAVEGRVDKIEKDVYEVVPAAKVEVER